MATVTVSGSRVEKIEAESAAKEVTGIIIDINFTAKNPVIAIEDDDGEENDYELDKNNHKKKQQACRRRDLKKVMR